MTVERSSEPRFEELRQVLADNATEVCSPSDVDDAAIVFGGGGAPPGSKFRVDSLGAYGVAVELEDRWGIDVEVLIGVIESDAPTTAAQLHDLVLETWRSANSTP